jgi:hypothetical protein
VPKSGLYDCAIVTATIFLESPSETGYLSDILSILQGAQGSQENSGTRFGRGEEAEFLLDSVAEKKLNFYKTTISA